MPYLTAFLKTRVGQWLARKAVEYGLLALKTWLTTIYRKVVDYFKDKKALENYENEVIKNNPNDKEEMEATEDFLNDSFKRGNS